MTKDFSDKPSTKLLQELQDSRELFALLVASVKDYAIVMLDPEGYILTWNDGAEKIKGYSANEIIGKHFSIFYTPEAIAENHPATELRNALRDGRYEEEGLRIRKDGTTFWAHVVFAPVYDNDILVGFSKVTRDLSERRAAQLQLSAAERKDEVFRLLVDSVKDYAVFMLDVSGNILTWNEGAKRIKGYSADEIIGKHFSQFYTEQDRERQHPQRELEIARSTGRYEEEGWRVRKDGTTFWANVVITPVWDQGTLVGFAKVTRDLTERRQAELRLQKSEQDEAIFRLMISNVKDYAIFMLDPHGIVLTWNEGAQRIKGYAASEIIGKHFSEFYTQEAKDRKHPDHELEIALKEGRYEEEGWRVRKDGGTFWASVVITAVMNHGTLLGFAKVTRDLSERRRDEQQRELNAQLLADTNDELRRALEVKGRFLSTISHEVRTPMAGIIGMTELLMVKDLGADNNAIVDGIFQSSKRLLQLLNNLLESARMESGAVTLEYRNFPLRAIIGEVRQLVAPEAYKKGLDVTGNCDANVPETICGDELRLRQVLLNLAFNAVKFTEKGAVDIGCSVEKDGEHDQLRFTVTDTGIGIKAEDQEHIFQPFAQADTATTRLYGGSGLGLSICKQLVDLMGGTIGFASQFGKGSSFWCKIPIDQGKCLI